MGYLSEHGRYLNKLTHALPGNGYLEVPANVWRQRTSNIELQCYFGEMVVCKSVVKNKMVFVGREGDFAIRMTFSRVINSSRYQEFKLQFGTYIRPT